MSLCTIFLPLLCALCRWRVDFGVLLLDRVALPFWDGDCWQVSGTFSLTGAVLLFLSGERLQRPFFFFFWILFTCSSNGSCEQIEAAEGENDHWCGNEFHVCLRSVLAGCYAAVSPGHFSPVNLYVLVQSLFCIAGCADTLNTTSF